jgi:hypothetical protein
MAAYVGAMPHGHRAVSAAFDPDTAAHSAKNAHAASGLPNHSHGYSERFPMVGTTTAPGAGQYKDITDLLAQRPGESDYVSVRVAWLFAMADALDQACLTDDAQDVREAALTLVREEIELVSGGAA